MTENVDFPPGYRPVFQQGFNAHVGPILGNFSGPPMGPHHFLLDVEHRHLNEPGSVHGGMLMGMADVVLGSTIANAAGGMGATISLNCDFLAGPKEGTQIEGAAEITRMTRSVAFVSGRLYSGDTTFLTASGIWKLFSNTDDDIPRPNEYEEVVPRWSIPDAPAGFINMPLPDPFEAHLGPFFVEPGYRDVDFDRGESFDVKLLLDERHVNARGVCHGGTLMTLADAILGAAAWFSSGQPTVTLSVQSSFLRGCKIGDWITAKPRLTRKTSSIIFVEIDIDVGDETVFTASSLWKVIGK